MPRLKRSAARTESKGTAVLLQDFPLALHRAMKAEAARRGIYVSNAYAEACEMFLVRLEQARRKKP